MREPLLQCSVSSLINLKTNVWENIYFRNKSNDHLIRVKLKCVQNKLKQNSIKVSTTQLMIPPLTKMSAALMADQKAGFDSDSLFQLSVTMDSGLGKGFSYLIPIKIN